MSTIWGVSQGSYSDYGVVAIFATKDLAEEYARIQNENSTSSYDQYEVEEFAFIESLPEHRIVLTVHGRLGAAAYGPREDTAVDWDGNAPDCQVHEFDDYGFQGFHLSVSVTGTDHERVRKVYTERIMQGKTDPRVVNPFTRAARP